MATDILKADESDPVIASIYSVLGPQINSVYTDQAFQKAYESLDVTAFAETFISFTEKVKAYNSFHLRERRLWSVKIGRGSIPTDLETSFIKTIPEGRQNYIDAFSAIDKMVVMLTETGFDTVLENRIAPFTQALSNDKDPFAQLVLGYFRDVGCSQEMIDEFHSNFKSTNYNFLSAGGFAKWRSLTSESVKAQVKILDYTEEHGFSYLRGECGPPAWAIIVSQILAAVGISISAWVVVAIIVSLLALLVTICLAAPADSWIRRQCNKLSILLPIFKF